MGLRHFSDETPRKASPNPNPTRYEILDLARGVRGLALRVHYPGCTTFEGMKILVFGPVEEKDLLRWKKIDPHFRDPTQALLKDEAPSPIARFPATDQGWRDALQYIRPEP